MDVYLSQFERTYSELAGSGKAPWLREGPVERGPAYNPYSGAVYRGLNGVMLDMAAAARNFRDPRWISLTEAAHLGLTLRHGEQPVPVAYTRPAVSLNSYYLMCNLEQFGEYPKMPERDVKLEREIGKEKLRTVLEQSGGAGFRTALDKVDRETAQDGSILTQALARYRLTQECNEYYTPPPAAGQLGREAKIGKDPLLLIRAVYRAETVKNKLISRARGGPERSGAVTKTPVKETSLNASFEGFSN
jgi:hypothetical protein